MGSVSELTCSICQFDHLIRRECFLGSQNKLAEISELLAPKRVDQLSGSIAGQSAEWALTGQGLHGTRSEASSRAHNSRKKHPRPIVFTTPKHGASSNRTSGLESSTRSHLLPNELTTARNSPETNFLHNLPNMGMLLNHVCVQTFCPIPGLFFLEVTFEFVYNLNL